MALEKRNEKSRSFGRFSNKFELFSGNECNADYFQAGNVRVGRS